MDSVVYIYIYPYMYIYISNIYIHTYIYLYIFIPSSSQKAKNVFYALKALKDANIFTKIDIEFILYN